MVNRTVIEYIRIGDGEHVLDHFVHWQPYVWMLLYTTVFTGMRMHHRQPCQISDCPLSTVALLLYEQIVSFFSECIRNYSPTETPQDRIHFIT